MGDGEATTQGKITRSFTTWIAIVSSVITVLLTVYNAWMKNRIDNAAAQLDSQRIALEAARDRVARYQFVRSILTGMDSSETEAKTLSVNLVRLALDSTEAARLFAGLKSSSDTSLARIGSIGVAAIADQPFVSLVQRMVGPDRDTRVAAYDTLTQRYTSSQAAVRQVLSLLEPPQIDALTPDGRINALVFLGGTHAEAWGPVEFARGQAALKTLQHMSAANAPGIGAKTREMIASFDRHLQSVARTQRTQS